MSGLILKDNIKEKALNLRFTKSEIGTLIKYIFGKQIEDAGVINRIYSNHDCLGTKIGKPWEKGERFYQYFKDNKLYQINSCMPAEVKAMVGLGFPPNPYL